MAGQRQVQRRVLDQDRPSKRVLSAADIAGDAVQGRGGPGEGQEVGLVDAAMGAPGQVLGDHERREPVGQGLQGGQVIGVRIGVGGQRQAHPVQRQRMPGADRLQPAQARPAGGHVVLGMDLEPQARRPWRPGPRHSAAI
jgi:hypothetical protein